MASRPLVKRFSISAREGITARSTSISALHACGKASLASMIAASSPSEASHAQSTAPMKAWSGDHSKKVGRRPDRTGLTCSCSFVHSNRLDSLGMQGATAPAPAPVAGPPPLPKASDALALTNSSLNQLQVRGPASSWD